MQQKEVKQSIAFHCLMLRRLIVRKSTQQLVQHNGSAQTSSKASHVTPSPRDCRRQYNMPKIQGLSTSLMISLQDKSKQGAVPAKHRIIDFKSKKDSNLQGQQSKLTTSTKK
jgi:hypothetical protein